MGLKVNETVEEDEYEASSLFCILQDQVSTINNVAKARPTVVYYPEVDINPVSLNDAFDLYISEGNEDMANFILTIADTAVDPIYFSEQEVAPKGVKLIEDISNTEIGITYYRDFLCKLREKYNVETNRTLRTDKLRKISAILNIETAKYLDAISACPCIPNDVKSSVISAVLLDYGIVLSNYLEPDKEVEVAVQSKLNKSVLLSLINHKGTFPEIHNRFIELKDFLPTYPGSEISFKRFLFGTLSELYVYQILAEFGIPHLSTQYGDINIGYDISLHRPNMEFLFDIKCSSAYEGREVRVLCPTKDKNSSPALLTYVNNNPNTVGVIVRVSSSFLSILTLSDPAAFHNQRNIHVKFRKRVAEIFNGLS